MLQKIWERTPVAVLRAGFSAIQPNTWIKPHYGMSNTKLKLHLGVVVPPNCARMRVGKETREWVQGKVLMFDDSFEHEVHNDCSEDRVVFQLVLSHPDLQTDPQYRAVVVDAH
jgi:aspartate beta-hydroxylase